MWQVDLVLMLRSLIGDLDAEKYTDERLKQVIVIAAYNVLNDATFAVDYTVKVGQVSLSPDPITENDTDFTVLTLYKSACILLGSEVKTEAACAVAMKDGASSIDLKGISVMLDKLKTSICAKYDELLNLYKMEGEADGISPGAAVLSPYSPASWSVNHNMDRFI